MFQTIAAVILLGIIVYLIFDKKNIKLKELWSKLTVLKRSILIIIIAIVIGALILVKLFSVPLFNTAIKDKASRSRIMLCLAEENVKSHISATGVIYVKDKATARRMRSILIREDLVPSSVDPWALFDIERWTTADFERNVKLRHSITEVVKQHIEALDDVDRVNVVIIMPEKTTFKGNQDPVTASVVLYTKPGSDLPTNRKKIEGVQKIVLKAITSLTAENVVISDLQGNILNDIEGVAEMDNVSVTEKEQKLIQKQEAIFRVKVLNALYQTFGNDRVHDLNIKIDMDKEYAPIIIKADNPEEPAGVEVINERQVSSEKRPTIGRVTVSVNIDGTWQKKYDETGKLVILNKGRIDREYRPVSDEDISKATLLVQNAVGYDRSRGDAVSVLCIPFDRTRQFEEEDSLYFRQQQTRKTLIITGIGIALLLVAFFLFRVEQKEQRSINSIEENRTELKNNTNIKSIISWLFLLIRHCMLVTLIVTICIACILPFAYKKTVLDYDGEYASDRLVYSEEFGFCKLITYYPDNISGNAKGFAVTNIPFEAFFSEKLQANKYGNYIADSKDWYDTYRMLATFGDNALVDSLAKIFLDSKISTRSIQIGKYGNYFATTFKDYCSKKYISEESVNNSIDN